MAAHLLTAGNILMTSDGVVKLCDFGCVEPWRHAAHGQRVLLRVNCWAAWTCIRVGIFYLLAGCCIMPWWPACSIAPFPRAFAGSHA